VTLAHATVAVSPADRGIASQRWALLGVAYLMLGGLAWIASQSAQPEEWWIHGVWCVVGLAIGLPMLARIFRASFALIMNDHRIMFLASFMAYFLFGALLLAIGPEIQAEQSLSYYPIGAPEALRADAANGLGFGISVIVAAIAHGRWIERISSIAAVHVSKIPQHLIVILFLALGTLASVYLFLHELEFRENEELVAGIVSASGRFSLVAIVLAIAYRGKREELLRPIAVLLGLFLSSSGLLLFNKTEVLLPLAAITIGAASRFGVRKVLPVALIGLVTTYLLIGNLVNYGRQTTGDRDEVSFSERLQIIKEGWSETRKLGEDEEYGAWARLCYVPPQAAAIDLWDEGQGGDQFRLLPWVFVPRFLAPGKPEMTKTGREFNVKLNGNDRSSTGQGIFASGYYAGGIFGLILASALCGWVIALSSAVSRGIDRHDALALLPFRLLGMYIAFRIDGDFVADYAGTFVFILYPIFGVYLLGSTRIKPKVQRWGGA